jgi:hypothetical protein
MVEASSSSGQTGSDQQTAHDDAPTPGAANGADSTDEAAPSNGFKAALDNVSEIVDYATYYLAAQFDKLKITLRDVALAAVVAVLGALTAVVLLIIGSFWLCMGMVDVLTNLFSGNRGLAELATGIIILGGIWIPVLAGIWFIRRRSLKKTMRKYEARRQRQRDRFGRDVSTPKAD